MIKAIGLALLGLFLASVLAPIAAPAQQSSQASSTPPGGIACAYNSVLPSITTGFAGWVQCDSTGHLLISGGGGGAITSPLGSATNDTGSVAVTTGTASNLGLLLTAPPNCAVNGTNTPWTGLTVGGAAQTGTVIACNIDLTSSGGVALGALANYGTAPTGKALPANAYITNTPAVTQSGSWTVTNNPAAAATGGALNAHYYSAASNNATNVKNAAGTVYSITVTQSTTTAMELKLYNLSTSPTCSSATGIVDNIPIPSNATSPGYHLTFPVGRAFSAGIGFCLVAFGAPAADTDNANAATGATVSFTYD